MTQTKIFTCYKFTQKTPKDGLPGQREGEVGLNNSEIISALENVRIDSEDFGGSIIRCYEALAEGGWVGASEIPLVKAWTKACDSIL